MLKRTMLYLDTDLTDRARAAVLDGHHPTLAALATAALEAELDRIEDVRGEPLGRVTRLLGGHRNAPAAA